MASWWWQACCVRGCSGCGQPIVHAPVLLCRLQVNTWSTTYYSQTAGQIKGWWLNYDICTRPFKGLCEVPRTAFTCPPAPPPAPLPSTASVCTCQPAAGHMPHLKQISLLLVARACAVPGPSLQFFGQKHQRQRQQLVSLAAQGTAVPACGKQTVYPSEQASASNMPVTE